jgi:hypothetical protein
MAISLAASAQDVGDVVLESGKYDFRLIIPQMAKGKDDITLPAELELTTKGLVIKTHGMMGNKVTLKGILQRGNLKVGITDTERDNIISFHFIGKVNTKRNAQGKVYGFIDGKVAFDGDWILTKNEESDKKESE